jgi:stage III sporulation protein AB
MKIIVCGIIVFGFFAIGWFIKIKAKRRVVFFESLIMFCNHLTTEISFQHDPIARIIKNNIAAYNKNLQQILEEYLYCIENKKTLSIETIKEFLWSGLKPQEAQQFATFLLELGRQGILEEQSKIELKKIVFMSCKDTANAYYNKEASIYMKLSIILGIATVIILL